MRDSSTVATYGSPRKLLVGVEAVPDDEAVGDLEAHVAACDVDLAPVGLGQQRADLERGRPARRQAAEQVRERQPGVDDVLDDEHVAAGDGASRSLRMRTTPELSVPEP